MTRAEQILKMLPATYQEMADRFGVDVDTVKHDIAKMRQQGVNIRAVGRKPNYTLELIDRVVNVPQTWAVAKWW